MVDLNLTCKEDEYISKRLGSCEKCPSGCSRCLNNDLTASPPALCRVCQTGFFLNQGRCEKICGERKLAVMSGNDQECKSCADERCIECVYIFTNSIPTQACKKCDKESMLNEKGVCDKLPSTNCSDS